MVEFVYFFQRRLINNKGFLVNLFGEDINGQNVEHLTYFKSAAAGEVIADSPKGNPSTWNDVDAVWGALYMLPKQCNSQFIVPSLWCYI